MHFLGSGNPAFAAAAHGPMKIQCSAGLFSSWTIGNFTPVLFSRYFCSSVVASLVDGNGLSGTTIVYWERPSEMIGNGVENLSDAQPVMKGAAADNNAAIKKTHIPSPIFELCFFDIITPCYLFSLHLLSLRGKPDPYGSSLADERRM